MARPTGSAEAEMARAMGSAEAERDVRGEEGSGRGFGGAVPVPMFVVLGAGGRAGSGVAGGGVDLVPKEPFTVRVKDGREWTAARRLSDTLQDFVTEVQRNALLLKLIDDDERIVRLQLPGADGSPPQELDVDATLGDVRICMGVGKVLLAVVAKPLPAAAAAAAPIPSRAPATTPLGARPETENRDQASATATAGVVEPGANPQQPVPAPVRGSQRRYQPSSSSANVTNPLSVPPSRGVGCLHPGHRHRKRYVVIKKRFEPEIRVTEVELNSDPHMTLMDKATSLGISLSALKNARLELELGRWPGRQERARLRRLQGRSVEDSRNSAERSPKQARTEGPAVIAATKQEFP